MHFMLYNIVGIVMRPPPPPPLNPELASALQKQACISKVALSLTKTNFAFINMLQSCLWIWDFCNDQLPQQEQNSREIHLCCW